MSHPENDFKINEPAKTPDAPDGTSLKAVAAWGSNSIFDRPDERYIGRSVITSFLIHAGVFLLIALAVFKPVETQLEAKPDKLDVVYLDQPGPGGGGGGSPAPAPAKQLEIPKPQAPTPVPTPVPVPVPEVVPQLTAPVMTNAATMLQATGNSSISLASYGGGGSGGGIGSGKGDGVGPGTGGGFGGGAYQPGNGCVSPVPTRRADPKYTSDAMRAKLQGDVELDVIVLQNGTVGDVRITKSLDTQFGLDTEAIAAAKKWIFHPATCQGKPVDMMVGLAIEFRLH